MNKFLLIAFLFAIAFRGYGQEKTTVTGQVLSAEDGKPIPGASVFIDKPGIGEQSSPGVIENNVIGSITDADGRFSLQVPAGTTHIRVSYLGYTSVLLNISNKSNLTVSLISDNNVLNEVVVNGYTDIAKRKNTTSLA